MSYNAQEELQGPYTEVEKIVGRLMYLKGHPFPMKGIPTLEDVNRANKLKSELKRPKVLLSLLNGSTGQIEALHAMITAILFYELCPAAQQIFIFVYRAADGLGVDRATKLAEIISFIFETDMAYRFRIQDLASETSTPALLQKPITEIYRLMKLNQERDNETVSYKFRYAAYALMLLLLIPKYRKKFRYALAVGIAPLQLDPGDRYWCSKRFDYGHNDAT
jgi:hypothetical protein